MLEWYKHFTPATLEELFHQPKTQKVIWKLTFSFTVKIGLPCAFQITISHLCHDPENCNILTQAFICVLSSVVDNDPDVKNFTTKTKSKLFNPTQVYPCSKPKAKAFLMNELARRQVIGRNQVSKMAQWTIAQVIRAIENLPLSKEEQNHIISQWNLLKAEMRNHFLETSGGAAAPCSGISDYMSVFFILLCVTTSRSVETNQLVTMWKKLSKGS